MNESSMQRQGGVAGKSFGQLLGWHLLRGTRPGAPQSRAGRKWSTKEFAAAVGMSDRTVRFWLQDQHSPPEIETLERVLFGENPSSCSEWRLELRQAHEATWHRKEARSPRHELPDATLSKSRRTRQPLLSSFERRPMTVVACRFVGLPPQHDPEHEQTSAMRVLRQAVAEIVQRFNGLAIWAPSDRLFVFFGYPEASEDDAERAVRAGLELVSASSRIGAKVSPPTRLRCRTGIATGAILVGDINAPQDWLGQPLNLALDLRDATPVDGGVMIAANTRALLGDFFKCEQLDPIAVDNGADRVPVWRVLSESAAVEGRFDALRRAGIVGLVNRDERMELLLRRWQKVHDGTGQVVILTGEAGIGKSRLAAEFEERIAARAGAKAGFLKYYGLPYQMNTSMFVVIGELKRACGFESADPLSARLNKLERVLYRAAAYSPDSMSLIS